MFDDDHDKDDSPDRSADRPIDPAQRAKEKADEFRTHAELAAVFEGVRKFDAAVRPRLDPELARDVQRTIARLEKAKSPDSPVLPPASADDAIRLLSLPLADDGPATNDYHVRARPGEALIVRWLAGPDELDLFYARLQAHFDAALAACRDDERNTHGWRQDPPTLAYLAALDAIDIRMADRYLREAIRAHNLFVLSTVTADEMDLLHLSDYLMGVDPADLVGPTSTPGDAPTERDRAWFFKLFSLRGVVEGVERMCFFTYLQKTEDTFEDGW
jgi:hypothetical protein